MSNEPEVIISIKFTENDIADMARDYDDSDIVVVPFDVAMDRARDWAGSIEDNAVERIGDALFSVVRHDTP